MQADLVGQQTDVFVKGGLVALYFLHGVKERQAFKGQTLHAPGLDLKDGADLAIAQDARRNWLRSGCCGSRPSSNS